MSLIVYTALCGLGWIVAAALFYLLCRTARHLRNQTGRERWAVVLLIVLVATVVGFNYVLAYPIAVSRLPAAGYSEFLDLFVPAEWLYDHTPLRGPMHSVGKEFGVAQSMESASESRMRGHTWGSTPPVLYAAGWLALAGSIVGGGVWLAVRIERLVKRT